jgi:guanyl-specific ribonuclease Sa
MGYSFPEIPMVRTLFRTFLSIGIALSLGLAGLRGATVFRSTAPSSAQVEPGQIPKAARETLAYIRKHQSAPPGYVGGRRFGNYGRGGEQKLPVRDAQGRTIQYQEWDIHPKIQGRNRGPERLVTGSDGRAWYTADHYFSFTELRGGDEP